jgi:uncharacterized protein (DUF1778 family)
MIFVEGNEGKVPGSSVTSNVLTKACSIVAQTMNRYFCQVISKKVVPVFHNSTNIQFHCREQREAMALLDESPRP